MNSYIVRAQNAHCKLYDTSLLNDIKVTINARAEWSGSVGQFSSSAFKYTIDGNIAVVTHDICGNALDCTLALLEGLVALTRDPRITKDTKLSINTDLIDVSTGSSEQVPATLNYLTLSLIGYVQMYAKMLDKDPSFYVSPAQSITLWLGERSSVVEINKQIKKHFQSKGKAQMQESNLITSYNKLIKYLDNSKIAISVNFGPIDDYISAYSASLTDDEQYVFNGQQLIIRVKSFSKSEISIKHMFELAIDAFIFAEVNNITIRHITIDCKVIHSYFKTGHAKTFKGACSQMVNICNVTREIADASKRVEHICAAKAPSVETSKTGSVKEQPKSPLLKHVGQLLSAAEYDHEFDIKTVVSAYLQLVHMRNKVTVSFAGSTMDIPVSDIKVDTLFYIALEDDPLLYDAMCVLFGGDEVDAVFPDVNVKYKHNISDGGNTPEIVNVAFIKTMVALSTVIKTLVK